jgi:hypothetical protein
MQINPNKIKMDTKQIATTSNVSAANLDNGITLSTNFRHAL